MKKIKKGKIVTVTSMKGGVGKTNVVLMLSSILANRGKKVLIIDLDLYTGDISFSLNIKPNGTIFNLCDDIANHRYKLGNSTSHITKYNENIDFLSSPKDPRQASKIDPNYISLMINEFTSKYDVILIDTTHVLNPHNMMAFELSDTILEIFTNDALDLKSTKTFISICKNMGVTNLYTVLNNSVDNRKNYFSKYDMKGLIGKNIDFIIPDNLYIKKFDAYLMDGNIMDLYLNKKEKDFSKFKSIADMILKDEKSDDHE